MEGIGGGKGASASQPSDSDFLSEGVERPELLAEPIGADRSVNVATAVAILIERSLSSRRQSADVRREAADRAQEAAENAQVGAMREEARDTFKQALVSCAISVAASATQMVAAGVQLRGADLQSKAADYTGRTKEWILGEAGRAETWGKCLEAGGKIFESVSAGANGVIAAEVKRDGIEAKEYENSAHRASRDAQRASDSDRELGELAARTLARLEELLQGHHQTQLALIQKA